MKRLFFLAALCVSTFSLRAGACWPDGTPIDAWFSDRTPVDTAALGPRYVVTDWGAVRDSTLVQTEALQRVIDRAAAAGGGVVVIPEGTFLSGALFFRPGTHLHLCEGARLKGSDDIADFPVVDTRIEGRSVRYFAALVHVENVPGFTLTGSGTIDGNGLRYWRSFWLRRAVNPDCTNLDELRPRLLYVARSNNVRIEGVTLCNSPFWTTHLYRSDSVRLMNLTIFAPAEPVRAPSTDAVDVDVCDGVLICNCRISVNDDAIALKGGKGPWADRLPENGPNRHVLIEACDFGYCHSALTCGSESLCDRNIVLRRCRVAGADRLLWLKMRPDTPQRYEYISVSQIEGSARTLLFIHPWRQFFDLQDRTDIPLSEAEHITLEQLDMDCERMFDCSFDAAQYRVADFRFDRLQVRERTPDGPRCVDAETAAAEFASASSR